MARRPNGDRVSLGAVLNFLIGAGVVAGATATLSVAVLAWRADASDNKVKEIDTRQRRIELTQALLQQEVAWTSAKLNALLAAQGIAVPPRPPLPEAKDIQ